MHRLKAFLVGLLVFRLLTVAGPLLLVTARSWRGRFEGFFLSVFGVMLTAGIVCVWYLATGRLPPAALTVVAFVSFAATGLLSFALVATLRKCHFGEGAVGAHYFGNPPNLGASGWTDTAEDYAWLLVLLVTRLDPWMPRAEAVAARAGVRELVEAVQSHADYHGLVRIGISDVLIRGRLDPEHCYSYLPPSPAADGRFGLLVFLNGHGTNHLIVLHALRPLCDELRMVLVCPTFGYGNWEAPGGVEAAERAMRFALAAFPTDPRRVIVMGYSQGGAGVSRLGARCAAELAGLVYISPTMEPAVIESQAFRDGWRGKPVLVIQGERDHNVKPRTVAAAVETMQANAALVTTHTDADAGHFLFFAKLAEVRGVIAAWALRSTI